MQINKKVEPIFTHEGGAAQHINAEQQLRRSVMACMLFEDNFYESGQSIAQRIKDIIPKVDPKTCYKIAVEAREKMGLRHAPLLIVREMARLPLHKRYVSRTLQKVITRPDQLADFLSLYWADNENKKTLSNKVKQGLAWAFKNFNEFQFAKNLHNDRAVKLRDVLFLSHSKPETPEQELLYKKLINNELQTPDTWEVALSAGEDKKETFTRLMIEKKLGALAFIRNLRNMTQVNIDPSIYHVYSMGIDVSKIFPWQFIAAAKNNPQLEPMIEDMLFRCVADKKKLPGRTIILVDVSGSMDDTLSKKSEMKRFDAAYGLTILLRELCENPHIFTFSNNVAEIPLRRGFALRDACHMSQMHSGTALQGAINVINHARTYDRIIVITDEQSNDGITAPRSKNAYIMNVGSYQNGVDYSRWTHISGFSSNVIEWIYQFERENR